MTFSYKKSILAASVVTAALCTSQISLTPTAAAQQANARAQQAPAPAANAEAPAVDLAGYWTPPMHEDALERGGGCELGDYAGFALN